jgi:hypothetical protein
MSTRSDGILVLGQPPHALVELSGTNLRAHCSLRSCHSRYRLRINFGFW